MRAGWIPIRVFWKDDRPMVDWCLLGRRRFTDPFFETTIHSHLEHPFHHAFRRQTPIEALGEWAEHSPGIPPNGFIFHQSRSGSTLVCTMLAALERNVVLAEPMPADSILRAHCRRPWIHLEQRVEWFRWMVSALGQKRGGSEDGLFIKFDAWNIAELPVIRQAFPKTPWLFLYREPVEVLVSHIRRPALWTIAGILDPHVLDMDSDSTAELPQDQYCARILARICSLGLTHYRGHGGLLINYRQLPNLVCSTMLEHFGTHCPEADRDRMRLAAQENAKQPGAPFSSDSGGKQEAVSEAVRELARVWMEPVYRELETARLEAPTRF